MNSNLSKIWSQVSFILLGSFWFFALMNPVFKKYDYGGGLPLILGIGVLLLVIGFFELRKERERNFWEQVFLIIFSLFVMLSFAFSQIQSFGLTEVMAFVSVSVVYLFLANRKIEWISSFLYLVALAAVFAVIVGSILYVTRGETRMFGTFYNKIYPGHVWPNAFALFIVMSWPIFILIFKKRSFLELSFVLGFVLSGLLLSYSRGAILVFSGQIVLLLLYFYKKANFKTIFTVILVGLFATMFFFSLNHIRAQNYEVINVEERAGFENKESLTSKQERVDFWKGAIELSKEKPWLGWGPFSFRYAYNGIQKTFLANSDHPHNVFLKIAAENGLIAMFAFVAFLFSIFLTVVNRFKYLKSDEKDLVYVLGVAVAGTFAHNLIDYNLNFLANILLLFLYLAFIRSIVVVKCEKSRLSIIPLLLALGLAVLAIYEGVLFIKYHAGDESYMEQSFFPRYHYLTAADKALHDENYDEAMRFLDREINLSPLSSQAWYLRAVIYCKDDYPGRDYALCKRDFGKALALNPMNDFNYYHDYFRQLEREKSEDIYEFLQRVKPMLFNYFEYVEFNVHFTSYTFNVEVAADFIDSIVPYIVDEEADKLIEGKEKMLKTAARQRAEKAF